MNCPRCQNQLNTSVYGDLELDECASCGGTWFDQGEFGQAKAAVAPDLQWLDFDVWKHPELFRLLPKPTKCPRCNNELFALNYEKTGVDIEVCNRCHGVWLDDGEFEKILDALDRQLATANISDYIKASLREGKEIFTGDEGIISEWKDFTTVLRLMQYRIFAEKPRLLRELLDAQGGAPIW